MNILRSVQFTLINIAGINAYTYMDENQLLTYYTVDGIKTQLSEFVDIVIVMASFNE